MTAFKTRFRDIPFEEAFSHCDLGYEATEERWEAVGRGKEVTVTGPIAGMEFWCDQLIFKSDFINLYGKQAHVCSHIIEVD